MKLLNLVLRNHPVLGDQNLKFSSISGHPFRMVIFAGENGVGKSTVMQIIHDFCNLNIPKLSKNETREVTLYLTHTEINSIRYPGSPIPSLDNVKGNSKIVLGFDGNLNSEANYFYMKVGSEKVCHCQYFLKNQHSKRILGSIYMDHDLNRAGNGEKLNSSDGLNWKGRRSSEGDGFSSEQGIFQLYAWAERENSYQDKYDGHYISYENQEFDSKNLPLNDAIAELVPSLSVYGISKKRGTVVMKKGENVFDYSFLSSGEKQILGMTSFLTYDLGVSTGAPILIDEPENNLHPNIQLGLRSYFRKLFPNDRQIFIVTHSPFVVHDKPSDNEKVFIFKRKKKKISISALGLFHGWEHVKRVNEVFNIDHLFNNLSSAPLILVEGETDQIYLNEVKRLYFKKVPIKIDWVGSYNTDGNAIFTGSSALDKVKDFIISNPTIISNKLILLYDCDVANIKATILGNLFIRKMPFNPETIMSKGIENSLVLPTDLDLSSFYSTKTIGKAYGEQTITKSFNKTKFASHICSLSIADKDKYFKSLKEFLAGIIEELL